MNTQTVSSEQSRIEHHEGSYKDLAKLGSDKFGELQELLLAIKGASDSNNDSQVISYDFAERGAEIATEMMLLFDFEESNTHNGERVRPLLTDVSIDKSENSVDKKVSKSKITNQDNKELLAIWCQLYSTIWFIGDTSKLLQQEDLFEMEGNSSGILTPGYNRQLLEAIHSLTIKQQELMGLVESNLDFDIHFPRDNVDRIGLFDMPRDDKSFVD